MATLLNKSANEVRISSLRNGSVLVAGSVDTKGEKDESSTLSKLSSALGVGSKISGQ